MKGPSSAIPWDVSPDQRELLGQAREFALAEIAPVAEQADEQRCMPEGISQRFHDSGLPARILAPTPTSPFIATTTMVVEEMGYYCAAIASYLLLPLFFNRAATDYLSGKERDDFVARYQAGPIVTSFAASEAAAGSDLAALATSAQRTETGYVLNGRKEYSSNLGAAQYVIVVARTGAAEARTSDTMSWFLVPTDSPGVVIGERWPTFGLRAIDVSPMELTNVEVPLAYRLGDEGRGLPMMGASLSMSRIGIAALGVAISRRARDIVLDHSRKRKIYGDKLSRMQDYRFRISDMEKTIAAARALVRVAAEKADRGEDPVKEASIAKLYSGENVMNITAAASAMLGSIGYTGQSPIEKLLRDGRHIAIVEGPEPTHKELIFAHMLRHGGY